MVTLAGHALAIEYLGDHAKFANTPPEGVRARCKCGWVGETRHRLYQARDDYRSHKTAEFGSGKRICTRCGERKLIAEMAKASKHLCRACLTAKTRAWADANPDQFDRARRNSHLLNGAWFVRSREWVEENRPGWTLRAYEPTFPFWADPGPPPDVPPGMILTGQSPRGDWLHCVVVDWQTGDLVHDPYPDGGGVLSLVDVVALVRKEWIGA